jgi:HSP20 family molecular chaperone IbpA
MNAMRTMGLAPVLPPDSQVAVFADEYLVRIAVPGFAREELDVEVVDHVVTVCGDQVQTASDDQPFRIHERLEERFMLPGDADASRVTASHSHGAVELHVPRTNGSCRAPRKVQIDHRLEMNPDASGV